MSTDLRLMAVHAHPDDESSKGAPAMARYVREGVEVLVVTCTGGERGEVLNPKMDRPEVWRDLPKIRSREMERAREILGVRQAWLGFVDSGYLKDYTPDRVDELPEDSFAREPLEVATAPLVRLIREFRPQVMTTYDESGGYPHPDHIMCHRVSVAAFEAAGDPERYQEFGEPWQPSKLYYNRNFHRDQIVALHEALLAAGLESHYSEWLSGNPDFGREASARVTTRVPCGEYFELRDEALRAHATQIDPDQWFRIPLELQLKAAPTEDFELARSTVEAKLPEDDLFAGLR